MPKYTENITYVFHGLPGHLDAGATYKGKTYFFKVWIQFGLGIS